MLRDTYMDHFISCSNTFTKLFISIILVLSSKNYNISIARTDSSRP